ncbi:MAG TPA: hypothetical protein VII99_06025 [Bacteroidia bacterium]
MLASLCAAKSNRAPSKTCTKKFLLASLILLPLFNYAQDKDSTTHDNHKMQIGLFVSGGLNYTHYYSDRFFNYLFTASGLNKPYGNTSGSVYLDKYDYSKIISTGIIGGGLKLCSSKIKKIRLSYTVEINYMKFSGQYSGTNAYSETTSGANGYYMFASVKDTITSQYTHNIVSFGYKFQPTYKFIFLSIGINCSVNNLMIHAVKKEYASGTWSDEMHPGTPFSDYNTKDFTSKIYFINFPLQLGTGLNIQIKNIFLKPAFYFSPCFTKGYNFYSFSLWIGYDFKKNNLKN